MEGEAQGALTALLADPKVALAISGAIATAAVGGVAYILRGVFGWLADAAQASRDELVVFKRFRVEAQIARDMLPATVDAAAEERTVAQSADYAARNEPFGIFNVTLVQHDVKDTMRGILHKFDNGEMRLIEEYIYVSKFLDNFYARMCSEEFAEMPHDRRAVVIRRYLHYARQQAELAPRVLAVLDAHPWSGSTRLDRAVASVARLLGG